MSEELKNCPFCGGKAVTMAKVTQMGGDVDVIDFSVVCGDCRIDKTVKLKIQGTASFADIGKAMSRVVDMWNRRV